MVGEKRRIAVTGATGFLGSHLTERLLQDGHAVRILTRDPAKAKRYEGRVDRIIEADITDQDAMKELVKDTDVVFHLVSNFRTTAGAPETYRKTNVEGTITAVNVARSAGVKRFVHCSTIGVMGHVKSTPGDEGTPFNPGDLYQETKLEAELFCKKAAAQGGMEIVIVRPCSIYGPGDLRMLKMFRMLSKRTFLMVGPCRENFHAVYIDDIVEGFIRAMDVPGIGGETFIIGGDKFLSLKDYIAVAAKAVDAPMPWLRFPYWIFHYAAILCEAVCAPFGVEPPLHRRRVRFFRNNRAFSIEKARKVLDYEPRVGLEVGMARTVTWYRDNGYL